MRLPSSSSLVFATLAISTSSSTLSTLAAPTGDPAQAQSGVSAPNNHFMAARRGSVSLPPSQDDDGQQEARSEEKVVEKRNGLLDSLSALLPDPLNPLITELLNTACPSSTAQSASFDTMSVSNSTDSSNSSYDDPAWSAPPNTPSTSSDAPVATSPPSRRDVPSPPASLPVQPTAVPDTIAGAVTPKVGTAEGVAPTQATGAAPADPKTVPGKVSGTFDGATGTAASEAIDPAAAPSIIAGKAGDTATVPGTAAGIITGGAGSAGSTVTGNAPAPAKDVSENGKGAADDKKQVPIKVVDSSPAPQPVQNAAGSAASTIPVRRSHRARRDIPASAPVQPPVSAAPSPPVHPPVSATPSPPVHPPVSASSSVPTTTITSTVTEAASPTSA